MAMGTPSRIFIACLLSAFGVAIHADPSPETLAKLQSHVFKVIAERSSGTVQVGSAVLVAAGKLVTNCHVLTWSRSIHILRGGNRWPAQLIGADKENDICILSASELPFRSDFEQTTDSAQIGQEVHAVGYPGGGELTVNCGKVRALHDYNEAKVIQTNAAFSPGASGGGLFDNDGKLLGILTFRAPSGGDFHFVLPIAWVDKLLARVGAGSALSTTDRAFYQRNQSQQPYFLQAAALEETHNWAALLDIAKRWSDQSANNPESWMAVGRACVALNKKDQAVSAFRQVLAIDSRHSLGRDLLNTLEPAAVCYTPDCLSNEDFLAFAEPVIP
jgi:serine protease Do